MTAEAQRDQRKCKQETAPLSVGSPGVSQPPGGSLLPPNVTLPTGSPLQDGPIERRNHTQAGFWNGKDTCIPRLARRPPVATVSHAAGRTLTCGPRSASQGLVKMEEMACGDLLWEVW